MSDITNTLDERCSNCSRYIGHGLPEYVRFPSINSSLSDLLTSFVFCFIAEFVLFYFLLFLFFVLACVVVFSYPVRRHFTCLTLEFAIYIYICFRSFSASQSVTT